MQVAIVLYPGFTAIDVIGPYDVLGRLPGTEVVFVAEAPGLVRNDLHSLSIDVVAALDDVPHPEVVLVGGGPGQADQMADGPLHTWLRRADETADWMTSVCTGSLILAAAGLLTGRRATTHWGALDQLTGLGATPVQERVVIDGHYATGAGASAGIDMALTLAGLIAGDDTAQAVQLLLEYAPQPPYNAGTRESAGPDVVAKLFAMFPHE
ncbi:glutamine amidotransferase [Streptomyces venezuelae]|uniref:Glutamine amidotransferase n=1 Tax=Streptomyces venezuelae TaxID=54571 RepID=A0A5P2CZM3_STRVZ|nr:DJ-1/PfpI family protein [Streptomyces venezuelae]QES47730.1 glutamine amidotransferase [Streptomyces venezuelae]